MESFKKSLAVLFAVLFVMSAVFALLLFNFDRRGFSAETYHKAFAKDDFYNKLPTVLAEAMITTDQSQLPIAMSGMDVQAWDSFFRTTVKLDLCLPQSTSRYRPAFACSAQDEHGRPFGCASHLRNIGSTARLHPDAARSNGL